MLIDFWVPNWSGHLQNEKITNEKNKKKRIWREARVNKKVNVNELQIILVKSVKKRRLVK